MFKSDPDNAFKKALEEKIISDVTDMLTQNTKNKLK